MANPFFIPNSTFLQAIVLDVINDPAAFRAQQNIDFILENVNHKHFIDRVPRNTIVAKILNDGRGKKEFRELCLPFFPPHLCFPVKPGERVWLISPSPAGTETSQYYWMCRVPAYLDNDDINYTVASRWLSYGKTVGEKTSGEDDKKDAEKDERLFGFPNGASKQKESFEINGGRHATAKLINNSLAIKSFKFEPVPRLTKRPGDFVIQGSNNASITLGTTRGEPGGFAEAAADDTRFEDFKGELDAEDYEIEGELFVRSSATQVDPTPPKIDPTDHSLTAAAIDIVVGRGLRVRSANGIEHPAEDSKQGFELLADGHSPTYPRVKLTSNPSDSEFKIGDKDDKGPDLSAIHTSTPGLIETSKNPQAFDKDVKENHFDHAIEGDPDFRYDAARIYITADSVPDLDFGLEEQLGTFGGVSLDNAVVGSSITSKADHIRIIARQDPTDAGSANALGSIRIIKEGPVPEPAGGESGGERAVISLEPNGTIYIDGPRIVIGNARLTPPTPVTQGEGQHVFIGGEDATESVILGEALCDALLAFAVDVMGMLGTAGASITGYTTSTPSEPVGTTPSLGNMGGPIFDNNQGPLVLQRFSENLTKALSHIGKTK